MSRRQLPCIVRSLVRYSPQAGAVVLRKYNTRTANVCLDTRGRPNLTLIVSAETETRPKVYALHSAETETETESLTQRKE